MVRAINKLTALRIKSIKKPGRYSDGDGLYLYVTGAGNRSWVFRYRDRSSGKLRDKGLGPLRDVTLEQARDAARGIRGGLRAGIDPIDARIAERTKARMERAKLQTFGQCVDRYIAAHEAGWRNSKHRDQWRNTLDTYASDLLPLPVAAIDTDLVLSALEPIWADKTETATRVRQRVEAVLDWATARKYRTGDNPARWRGHLDKLLAKPTKIKAVQSRAALPYTDVPALYQELLKERGLSPAALQLQILTALRPGEVVAAQWSEFDLDNGVWTVPGARMKAGKDHRVPLAPEALVLLRELHTTDKWVFPGMRGKSMTTAAPLKVLKALRPGMTAHGFRSTFRDWAADCTAYPREVAEQALAHALKDKTEAAYRRSDLFAKRAMLMADWAKYATKPAKSGSVSSLDKARKKRRAG